MAKKVLSPAQLGFSWTSKEKHLETLHEINKDYDFGLTKKKLSRIKKELESYEQSSGFLPFSISIWLSDLDNTCHKLLRCLADKAKTYGLEIGECFYENGLSFADNSMKYKEGKNTLKVFTLDFGLDGTPQFEKTRIEFTVKTPEGIVLMSVNLGIEILSFLVFNPQVLPFLNERTLGPLKANGIRICGLAPVIGYSEKEKRVSISFEP